MKKRETFGSTLRRHRKHYGLSLTKVAEETSIAKSYLSDMENDKSENPSIDTFVRLCNMYGLDKERMIDEFFHVEIHYNVVR